MKELKLNKVWNQTSKVFGISIATIMWDSKPWKVINEGITFDQLTHCKETKDNGRFNLTIRTRTYTPIKEFKYQTELADYILQTLRGGE